MRGVSTRSGDIPDSIDQNRNKSGYGRVARAGILVAFALGFIAQNAQAQNKAVSLSVVSGGGGVSKGSRFSVTGSIGQHDATVTRMAGSRFGVQGGFHALVAIQTPGAPELSISVSNGQVIVSWSAEASGFTLEQTGALGPPANWTTSPGVSDNQLRLTSPSGTLFFRLAPSE